MLILLSPAKKLLNITKHYKNSTSQPSYADKTAILVKLMQAKSIEDIAALMDLSANLAALNFERYQSFDNHSSTRSYPALFLFQGDVYQALKADSWEKKTVDYSQSHLRILSGLYGLLKPLDCIQPYRLEMGIHLANPIGKNLYDFWQDTITQTLNQQLEEQQNPIVINLASTEYSKAVNEKKLNYPMININFYEQKNNQMKIIGIYAKKARGVMARYLLENKIDDVEQLKQFNELGYQYQQSTSSVTTFNFIRGN